jgi:hypothetical protein
MDRRALGGLLLVGGGLAVVGLGGALAYRSSQRTMSSPAPLGRSRPRRAPQERVPDRGMTLSHYRSRRMPIRERVGILQDMTAKSVKQASMRKLALEVTSKCPARDGACEARAIYDWMRGNIRYTGDIAPHKLSKNGPVEAVDLFQRADRTVEFRGGDCDDHSILGCTLAILNGLECRFRVTSTTRNAAEDFGHIYPIVGLPKNAPRKWVAIDSTLPGQNFGVEAPYRKHLDFIA